MITWIKSLWARLFRKSKQITAEEAADIAERINKGL